MTWGHMNAGGWLLMTAFWILVVVVVTIVIVRLLSSRPLAADDTGRAREILADRFARGEIETEEYRERLNELDQHEPSS
jgi:putative membrane protein